MSNKERVEIRYGVVKNTRGLDTGYTPWMTCAVARHKSTWDARCLSKEEAMEEARLRALNEAARYGGDWDVVLTSEDAP